RLTTLNRPSPSLVAVSSLPVSLFLTVTVAPGTTAPLGSVTEPPTAPVTVPCAQATAQNAKMSTEVKPNLRNLLITGELLREISIVETLQRATHRAPIVVKLPNTFWTAS